MKALLKNQKAATVAEYATFLSLFFTLGLIAFISLNDMGRDLYPDGRRDPDLLSDRITEHCLTRTRANDTVIPRQAEPYNCFKLAEGNDRITVDQGDNIIYPGTGRNIIVADPGSRDTQIVYQGGNDILHMAGGRSILDMRDYTRDQITFDVIKKSPATIKPGSRFDLNDRPAVDLKIITPDNTVFISDHFRNGPLSLLVLKDERIYTDEIYQEAIADQVSSRNDTILGTPLADTISSGSGSDNIQSFGGDDVITYTSGRDRYDPGAGKDILEFPDVSSEDVTFSVSSNRNDISIMLDKKNTALLIDQLLYPPSSGRVQFYAIHFADTVLWERNILDRAIKDQGTDSNDSIQGTNYSDTFWPGLGKNTILPGGGNDIIHYQGGEDTIIFRPEDMGGTNILALDNYMRSEITFSASEEGDLVLTTPVGSTITVKKQFPLLEQEHPGGIKLFRFKDEELDIGIILHLYFPDFVARKPDFRW